MTSFLPSVTCFFFSDSFNDLFFATTILKFHYDVSEWGFYKTGPFYKTWAFNIFPQFGNSCHQFYEMFLCYFCDKVQRTILVLVFASNILVMLHLLSSVSIFFPHPLLNSVLLILLFESYILNFPKIQVFNISIISFLFSKRSCSINAILFLDIKYLLSLSEDINYSFFQKNMFFLLSAVSASSIRFLFSGLFWSFPSCWNLS